MAPCQDYPLVPILVEKSFEVVVIVSAVVVAPLFVAAAPQIAEVAPLVVEFHCFDRYRSNDDGCDDGDHGDVYDGVSLISYVFYSFCASQYP